MHSTADSTPRAAQLFAAPHRLLFFVGASNVLLAMAWWAAWLGAARFGAAMPSPRPYAGWLHAFVMQYQMLPSFVFGFLLTTFPRWMGLPDVDRWRYAPVGVGLFGGQLATLLGAIGWDAGIVVGAFMTLAGWLAGIATLAPLLWREKGTTWHARSCFAALVVGLVGLLAWIGFLLTGSPMSAYAAIKLGGFGLLLPLYWTVAHRMFPFFAGAVVKPYAVWRPMWLLAAMWPAVLLHLGLELMHAYAWTWLPDFALLALSATALVRWWPRGRKPFILTALFLGYAWLPVAFALYIVQSLAYLLQGVFPLGRAPAHALFIGFFGSVLIAMVTRVTQGHSGRPLSMPPVAVYAFAAINMVAVVRIVAEVSRDPMLWQTLAAAGWLVALTPWILRLGRIYLAPRVDGKAG
ncbi:NnrS family protein [Cognatilysobacter lacus]|uniref:NnrS family protein n=1 Tax=Cognatilysobacter lacus TaxID=1643323 RepID=A0A5D8Z6S4_9GAMM|nr:NnrS family protein [Lysobacter lacus]TZF90489.1 NnrS family protein [Lysobacter lacus]